MRGKAEEEAAAVKLPREKQVSEKRADIDAIKQLLETIGLSPSGSSRYAEILVVDQKVDSVVKFRRKVGSDIAGYSATLQLDTDDAELLEEYFKRHMNVSTPPPQLSSPGTAANSSAASAGGGAATKTPSHWTCFMVLSSPLDLVHASRLTCSSLT